MGARGDRGTAARRGRARVAAGPGRATLVAGLVVAMGIPASAAPGAGPDAELRPRARVGFTSVDEVTATHGSSAELFVAGLDARRASEPVAVTDTVAADRVPFVWSPDGTRLAFQAWNRFDLTAGVSVTDALGGSPTRVADEVDSFDWSADGARVVLGAVDRVWTVRDDGSSPREVFRVPHVTANGEQYPSEQVTVDWAPAGDKVLVSASTYLEGQADAVGRWVVDVGSGESTRIDWASDAEWSPDGTKFAARDADDEGQYELVTASAAQPDKVMARFAEAGWPFAWAPGGDQLAYEVSGPDAPPSGSRPPCCTPRSIRVARADGTEDREVASLPTPLSLAWSADGSQLAVAGQFGQVTVVDDDGEENVAPHNAVWAVTLADGSVTELWRTTDAVGSMEWLPDGSAIVADTSSVWDCCSSHVMVIPTSGGEPYALPRTDGGARSQGPWARQPAVAPQAFRSTLRVMGPDRVATAVELSRAAFTSADAVVIARADTYPDALAGAPLAAQLQGPLLLSASDRLDPPVAQEIDRLGATRAVVLGTEHVLSDAVVSQLRERGISDVDRIGGTDRFATAAMIADRLDDHDEVFLVEGANADPNRGWPDAVAVAGLAAASGRPILLTETATLPTPTRQWLAERSPQHATIVGGPVAVSREVAQHADRLAGSADRIAGADRYETASLVATAAIEHGLPTTTLAVTGAKWPDSLTAGVAAEHLGLVMLMVPPGGLGDSASAAWIRDHAPTIDTMALVGGTVALPAAVQREIADLLAR